MIDFMAARIAARVKKSVPDHPSSEEVLHFATGLFLNTIFIIGGTLLISLWTGNTGQAALVLVGFAVLRQLTGGIHLRSGTLCVLYSTAIFTIISSVTFAKEWAIIITVLTLVLIILFAPSGIDKQSRINPKYFPAMKIAAACIVASNLLVQSSALSLCYLIQGLTLIHGRGVRPDEIVR